MTATAPATRARKRDAALVVQIAVYVAFSAPIGMLGAGWPEVHHEYGRSLGALGIVVGLYGMGRLVTSATALPLLRRWHVRHASSAVLVGLAATCVAVAVSRSFVVLTVAIALNGVFGGVLDSIGNHFQTVLRNVGRAGLMFGAYGVGATVGPAVVALTTWSTGYLATAVVALATAGLALRRPVRWPGAFDEREPPRAVAKQAKVPMGSLMILLTVFGTYCAIEVITANWGASFLQDHRGTSSRVAGLAISGFWAGMTIGRFCLGLVRTTPNRVLGGAAIGICACYLAIATLPTAAAIGALVLAGVVLSAMFPTLMSTTADRVGVAAAGRVSGWELFAANIASTGLSSIAGVLVARYGAGAPTILTAALAIVGLPLLAWSLRVHVGATSA